MTTVTTNISSLNVLQKTEKGANIITKSTNNPQVPGNGPALAEFSTGQAALVAANAAVIATRETLKQQGAARDAAEIAWDNKCTNLAAFTQTATGGNEVAILSSGFGVRQPNTPTPPASAPANLSVKTNGSPGVSKLKWSPVPGAVSYLVQMSPDPITESSWEQVATPTKSFCDTTGAVPGKICWFRVSAVISDAGGPWSGPVQREVV